MSNREILEKAIQKAIDGGWKEPNGNTLRVDDEGYIYSLVNFSEKHEGFRAYGAQFGLEKLIFSHDFAKALWGEEAELKDVQYTLELSDGEVTTPIYRLAMPLWKWHLQQMVIDDDPIKYLGENTHLNPTKGLYHFDGQFFVRKRVV